MTTGLLSALVKLDHITAVGVHLTVPEAIAVREALGGRAVVRDWVTAATEGEDEARMYRVLTEMDGVKEV